MASPSSCSHWWHAPFYIAAAIAVIIAATSPSTTTSSPSAALRRSGFHVAAAVLDISPIPAGNPVTLFATPDADATDIPLADVAVLLRRQTVPLRLSAADLRALPRGACLPTLSPPDRILVAVDVGAVTVNGVPVSVPDIFVGGDHAVHGAAGAMDPGPACEPAVRWAELVWVLVARGYVAFSVGLSVVSDVLEVGMDQVTVFAPADGGFDLAAWPGAALERAVRCHVAVGRLGIENLTAMHVGEEIRTLATGEVLRITGSGDTAAAVEINGAVITEPEVYMGAGFVVHGIAQSFQLTTT